MSPDRTRSGQLPRTPFAPLDEVTCYHDKPGEPNNVHLEVLVPGHLDENVLRKAVTGAIAAAPRASGRMAAGHALRHRYLWEFPATPDVDPVSRATWSNEDELAAIRNRFLAVAPPLRRSPPVRLLLAAGPEATCVLMNAHHAALDGKSTLALLRDIAARYQAIAGEAGPSAAEVEDSVDNRLPGASGNRLPGASGNRLPGASGNRLPGASAARLRPLEAGLASVASSLLVAPSAPVTMPAPVAPPARVRLMRRYPAARIAADRERRGRRDGYGVRLLLLPVVPRPASGATVTDLLVAALIATIARWNAAHRRVPRAIAISVPVSMHVPGMPAVAGNHSRIVTVVVGPATAAGPPAALLAEVSRRLTETRQARPQGASAGVLDVVPGWWPVALKRMAIRVALGTVGRAVCDTTMLSNLGNITGAPWSGPGGPVRIGFSARRTCRVAYRSAR